MDTGGNYAYYSPVCILPVCIVLLPYVMTDVVSFTRTGTLFTSYYCHQSKMRLKTNKARNHIPFIDFFSSVRSN